MSLEGPREPADIPSSPNPSRESGRESIEDLGIEIGDTIHTKSGRSADVFGIIQDDEEAGGGYYAIRYPDREGNDKKSKLTFEHLQNHRDRIDRITKLETSGSSDVQDKREHTQPPEEPIAASETVAAFGRLTNRERNPQISDEVLAYFQDVIDRYHRDSVKQVIGKMTEGEKRDYQKLIEQNNLPGLIHWMEQAFEKEFDAEYRKKTGRYLRMTVSDDPKERRESHAMLRNQMMRQLKIEERVRMRIEKSGKNKESLDSLRKYRDIIR